MFKFCQIFLIAALFASCYPQGPEYVSDLDLMLTDYDSEFDFGAQQTFFLLDSVVKIDDDSSQDITNVYDDLVLNTIRTNMTTRGYTEVNSVSQANVVLTTVAFAVTSTNYVYDWWGSWGWGYPGYAPGWGYYYPPGYSYSVSYTFGTILIEMSHPAGADIQAETIPVVWAGLINGLLQGSSASTQSRIESSIDQCFTQSPYIQTN